MFRKGDRVRVKSEYHTDLITFKLGNLKGTITENNKIAPFVLFDEKIESIHHDNTWSISQDYLELIDDFNIDKIINLLDELENRLK